MFYNSKKKIVDNEITYIEHYKELRFRFLLSLFCFLFIFLASYFTAPTFISYLKNSANSFNITLNIFKVTESVSIYLRTMLFQAICLTIPIFIIQMYLFVRPALDIKIRKVCRGILPLVSILFFAGSYIGYKFFVPLLLSFFLNVSANMGISTVYSFSDYFTFTFTICIIFGLILELPVLLCFLTLINVITPKTLKSQRKFIYPALGILSALVTPPDFVSNLIVFSILALLFEFSIFLTQIISTSRSKKSLSNSRIPKGGELDV